MYFRIISSEMGSWGIYLSTPILHTHASSVEDYPRSLNSFCTSGLSCACQRVLPGFGGNFEELTTCVLEMWVCQHGWGRCSPQLQLKSGVAWGTVVNNSFEKGCYASTTVSKVGHTYLVQALPQHWCNRQHKISKRFLLDILLHVPLPPLLSLHWLFFWK